MGGVPDSSGAGRPRASLIFRRVTRPNPASHLAERDPPPPKQIARTWGAVRVGGKGRRALLYRLIRGSTRAVWRIPQSLRSG